MKRNAHTIRECFFRTSFGIAFVCLNNKHSLFSGYITNFNCSLYTKCTVCTLLVDVDSTSLHSVHAFHFWILVKYIHVKIHWYFCCFANAQTIFFSSQLSLCSTAKHFFPFFNSLTNLIRCGTFNIFLIEIALSLSTSQQSIFVFN